MILSKRIFLLSLFFLFSIALKAQSKQRTILIVKTQVKDKKVSKLLLYQKEHKDSLSLMRELRKVILRFHAAAYIAAGIDSIAKRNDTMFAYLDAGTSVRWAKLRKGNAGNEMLSKVGFKERFYSNNPFNYREYARLTEAIIRYSENHGYPFAVIGLDSIQFKNAGHISASLNYRPGPFIKFDSVEIIGNTKVKKKFLLAYLRIFPGYPFSQERINNLPGLLKELSYVRETKPYTITFTNNKAMVTLYLEDRKTNQADGIVGFLPNQSASKKLLVTGELNLHLRNLFGTGKSFSGEWRKFNQASQTLNLSYFHPRIFSANLDIKADFNLFKQDTTFLTVDRKITFSQRTGKHSTIHFSGGLKTSRALGDLSHQDNSPAIPSFSNFNYYAYGAGYNWNSLNDIFFPHRGSQIAIQIAGGNKNIRKSPFLPDSVYKKIKINSVQFNLNFNLEKYFALKKRSVLLTRINGGQIVNNQGSLFFNDLYRVGGLRSLRGFNENFFYASSFAVGTVEYRFFTEETSYLLLFFDQAIIRNTLNKTLPVDYPFGFGAGVSFSTGTGVFNFVYSLGSSQNQKISLNLSKIHFGLITRF